MSGEYHVGTFSRPHLNLLLERRLFVCHSCEQGRLLREWYLKKFLLGSTEKLSKNKVLYYVPVIFHERFSFQIHRTPLRYNFQGFGQLFPQPPRRSFVTVSFFVFLPAKLLLTFHNMSTGHFPWQ